MKNSTIYKRRLYLLFFIIHLFGYLSPLLAAQYVEGDHFKISGRIHIEDCDSVQLQLHTYYLPLSINSFQKIVVPVIDGLFEYESDIPINANRPFNLGIYLYVKDRTMGLLEVRNLFLALPNDQITLDVGKSGVTFSGQGSEKYNVRWALDRFVLKTLFKGTIKEVLGGEDGSGKLAILEAQHDSLYQEKLYYIEMHKDRLTPAEYWMLKYDALGIRQRMLLRTISILATTLGAKDSLLKAHYIAHFQKMYHDFEPDTVDSELKAYAQNFAEYQFDVIHLQHALSRGGGHNFYFGNESEVYHYIRENYSGLLRDKMLVMTVQRYSAMDHDSELLKEACKDVEDDYFNRLVCLSLYRGGIGAKIPAFELINTAGTVQTFVPEKGKITLIDFWYTGCGACALLSSHLHSYLDSMQNVSDFRLVSISIDKNRMKWINSIESGKYTHPSALNFYTNGLGSRHPMTMYFNIIGYPRFLLIDREGNILSSYVYPTLQNISGLVNKALRGI